MYSAIFPYSNKYSHLKNYWWHRLFSVLFTPFILVILGFSLYISYVKAYMPYYNCMHQTTGGHNWFGLTTEQYCQGLYPAHMNLESYIICLLITIVAFYFVQFLYYKGLVYVIVGDKKA
jgi:hypothetical protein